MAQKPHIEKSGIVKRSVVLRGHKTSVSLEGPFWNALLEIAAERGMTISKLVSEIDDDRKFGNLSSALRLFILQFYQDRRSSLTVSR